MIWSFILSASGLVTIYLIPRHPKPAYVFALCIQPVWAWYSVYTEQWGFMLTTVAFTIMYARALRLELRNNGEAECA